ncbi:zinc carboxypeptidase-like [Ostrinia furnacalis]|uniref:zinc carboxypeptidase-like n=1 Tax=Ostrinia furnacalis TaxID=93504 RepID=UPI001040706B|nr:zinc carboxypeptidase-like [Ostrinia furnacalis]
MKSIAIIALFGVFGSAFAVNSYENYKVYKVVPNSVEQVQILVDLRKEGYDFWTDVFDVGSDVRIMVSPSQDEEFSQYITKVRLNAVVAIANVQELINAQKIPAENARSSRLGSYSWDRYYSLSEIHAWLDELETTYPDYVKTVTVGRSYEGREIKGVVIDLKAGNREGTPLVGMIEGGIHAREWISPATVTWIIKEFLTSTDPDVKFMAETLVWHIFPVINPDGYLYSFNNDRMWRKNRNPANHVQCGTDDDIGNGIDLNRNFDFVWRTIGASSNPCDQTYSGPTPSSELEAIAISNYVLQLKASGNMIYYFAFHSYSQMILVPYSHVTGYGVLEAENYPDMYEIAIRGAEKLTARHGTQYTVGTSAEILYAVSGSSFDWVKGVADIPIVYLFELRDIGEYGFLLPTEQIIPNAEEIMDCLVEMEKTTRKLGYYTGAANGVVSSILAVTFGVLMMVLNY